MASREEYVAAAAALGEIAQEYIDKIPGGAIGREIRKHIDLDQIGEIINDAAVKAVDAAQKKREEMAKPA